MYMYIYTYIRFSLTNAYYSRLSHLFLATQEITEEPKEEPKELPKRPVAASFVFRGLELPKFAMVNKNVS